MSQVEGRAPGPFQKANFSSSPGGKKLRTTLLQAQGFVESCEIMSTETQEGGGGCRVNEAGGVEASDSGEAKICPQASRQQKALVLILYKVMSGAHVGVGRAQIYFNILLVLPVRGGMWSLPTRPRTTVTL